MKLLSQSVLMLVVIAVMFCADVQVWAQASSDVPTQLGEALYHPASVNYLGTGMGASLGDTPRHAPEECHQGSDFDCPQCSTASCFGYPAPGFYAGAEYLLIRPHFSEAIAFAQGTQTPTTLATEGRELQFGYDSSFRVFAGYRRGYGQGELRFTFWHFEGDISVEGTAGPGQFIVDPFGNVVGAVTVLDLYGRFAPTALVGGNLIRTKAAVETNVYDFDFVKPILSRSPNWGLNWSAGVRIADIDQYYESVITLAGAPLSRGDFAANFIGAGPRLGVEARRHFGVEGRLSLFANGHASLLLGENTIRSSNAPNPAFSASQSESLTRTIPVMETELGVSWAIGDSLHVSGGWMFQAWLDMGVSGGQFGGLFVGADDSNVMSFDGMFLRGEWTF